LKSTVESNKKRKQYIKLKACNTSRITSIKSEGTRFNQDC